METMKNDVKLGSYLLVFSLSYIVLGLIMTVVTSYFEIKNMNLSFFLLVTATIITCIRFVHKNKRPFSNSEKWKMVIGSTLLTLCMSLLFLVSHLSLSFLETMIFLKMIYAKLSLMMWLGLFFGAILIEVAIFETCYGFITDKYYSKFYKKKYL